MRRKLIRLFLLACGLAILTAVAATQAFAAPLTGCTDYCHEPTDKGMDKRLKPLNPSQCIDCHLDEQREWDFSAHSYTAKKVKAHLPATDHKVSECGGCHSAEYILAPADHKPQAWEQLNAGITCSMCHLDHSQGERPGDRKLLDCETCHSGLARGFGLGAYFVFNPQAEVHSGIAPAFLETQSVPNPVKAHTCTNCHMANLGQGRRSHSLSAKLPDSPEFTCGQIGCHTGKGEQYTDLARGWQREIHRTLQQLRSVVEAKKQFTAGNPANLKHYQIAKYEFDMVLGDLSFGVHNIDFARHLLADARQHLSEIK
ncbi:MAG: hypothetical protein ACM3RP_07575 [Chitinophagales bacterium]